MVNALTIDVEDYFQVNAFAKVVSRSVWDQYPLRVENNTLRVMDMLDEFKVKATFFILGWVAERLPGLSKEIDGRGHEVACHGYGHELIYLIGPERFREDVRRAKLILEDQIGRKVIGYRAPSYSITEQSIWAFDILIDEGFVYDSSIFPIWHDVYGVPSAYRFPHMQKRQGGEIQEFPLTTLLFQIGPKGYRLPIAGGGYLRLLPMSVTRWGINVINKQEQQPVVLYFHPWEIDVQQPRIHAGLRSTFRHYINLGKTEWKLRKILSTFEFAPMQNLLQFN